MPWLVREGKVLATLEVADSPRARTRGLLGRDAIEGAILLRPAKSVHTFRMRFPIDVAYCDHDLQVVKVVTMKANRIGLPVPKAHAVIETQAGVMRSWELHPGDRLEVRGADGDGDGQDDGDDGDDRDDRDDRDHRDDPGERRRAVDRGEPTA